MPEVLIGSVELPPIDERIALRYAGAGESEEMKVLLQRCERGLEFTPRVTYTLLSKEEFFTVVSSSEGSMSLTKLLKECKNVVLFAATVGINFDRELARRQRISLAEAQLLQGIATERIEAACDAFCRGWKGATKRFSPGYGDFSLEAQREIFRILKPERIGLSLTESLMMTPTKSVTAVFGIHG